MGLNTNLSAMAAQIVIGPRRDGQGRSVGCQSAGESDADDALDISRR